jgi:type I restriction enzyme S subunit
MVPEGWHTASLVDLCSKPISYGIVQTGEKDVGTIPCVRVVDLTRTTIDRAEMITTTEEISRAYRKTVLEPDEIMMALRGEIGLVKLVPKELAGCNLTRGIARISAKKSIVRPDYLLRQIQSDHFRTELLRRVNGSALQEIPLGELRAVTVLVAPLPEQQKIAEILSTWDKAIQTTEALLANARTQKRALMQSLLTGTRRFPGFEDHPWREVRLGDLGRCIRGVSYKPDQTLQQETPKSIRLYRATNIQMGEIVESDLVFVPAELVTDERILRTGDLAVCMSNGSKHLVGKSAPFRGTDSCHTVGAFCAIFRPHDIHEADFVRSLFQSPKFDDQITTSLAGSSINNLKNSDIDGMRFPIPSSKDERLLITQALMTIEDEINRSFVMLDHLRTEKKSLMQQLLTGKRRVVSHE